MSKSEERSIGELVSSALDKDDEDHARWGDIGALQDRGGSEVFTAAARLISSGDRRERSLGVDILAQGHIAAKPMRDRAIPLLLDLAAWERDPTVIASLCHAFGHLHDPATIDTVRLWADHLDENVRFGVVHGLSGYEDNRAIETLIQLSDDNDSDVRDWATFGLGTQIEADTPAIRDALRARLDDPDDDTRMEALAGLARRCDPGVIEALRVLLADTDADTLPLEAGLALADSAFHGAIALLAGAWEREEAPMNVIATLEAAIVDCQLPSLAGVQTAFPY